MRPTWKSRKLQFLQLQIIVLLAIITTTNAGAIRLKRREISDQSHATTTTITTIDQNVTEITTQKSTTSEAPIIVDTPSSIAQLTTTIKNVNNISTQNLLQSYRKNTNQTENNAELMKVSTESIQPEITTKLNIDSVPSLDELNSIATVNNLDIESTTTTTTFETLTATAAAAIQDDIVTATKAINTDYGTKIDGTTTTTTAIAEIVTSWDRLISGDGTTEANDADLIRYTSRINDVRTPKFMQRTTTYSGQLDDTTLEHERRLKDIKFTTTPFLFHNSETTFVDDIDDDATTPEFSKLAIEDSASDPTTETNSSTILEITEVESTNYDIATNEIKNSTVDHQSSGVDGEKREKTPQPEESNLTIPNTAEVWALASMKNVEHIKSKEGHLSNKTVSDKSKSMKDGGTSVTKELHDWAEIMKTVDIGNNSFTSNANSIENALEVNKIEKETRIEKLKEPVEQENKVTPVFVEPPKHIKVTHPISTTLSTDFQDIIVKTPSSVDKNKVEDVEEIILNTHKKPFANRENTIETISQKPETSVIAPMKITKFASTTPRIVETTIQQDTTTSATNLMLTPSLVSTQPTTHLPKRTTAQLITTTIAQVENESTTAIDDYMVESEITNNSPSSTTAPESDIFELTSPSDEIPNDSTVEANTMYIRSTASILLETLKIATTEPSTTPLHGSIVHFNIVSPKSITIPSSTSHQIPRKQPTTHEPPLSTTYDPQVSPTEPAEGKEPEETDVNVIIAISVSVVGIIALILLVGFLYVMRKRQKQITYGQRCRPVSLDAYSLDNVSVFNSVRRKGILRTSKRSYGNAAFDDPSLKHHTMSTHELARFVDKKMNIYEEFKDVPQIIARADEVPSGCEDKNRYANVIPLPETRVMLKQLNADERTEYINANFVRGPKDPPNYYIACQAPLESTIFDFWRMIWEQNSRVIIMATDLTENGIEKCAEYLPPSITLDNHTVYGDFQITLKNREVKDSYAVSTLHVKNISSNTWREMTHFWYQWPETGVPSDEAGVIAMLLEARSCLKMATPEQIGDDDGDNDKQQQNGNIHDSTGSLDKTKSLPKTQGPLTVHCSPGTGRTGTIISCDMALRSLEQPKRSIDIPQIVYFVRRGRASAVQTKEQYEFIYKVAHMYATKISGPVNDN